MRFSSLAMFGLVVCVLTAGLVTSTQADVTPYTLTSGNSTVVIDPYLGGVTDWTVQGQDQLVQQWFWYRLGTDPETSISSLPLTAMPGSLTPGASASFKFSDAANDFDIIVSFTLAGGGPASMDSDLHETIRIVNKDQVNDLDITFFQFANFDLNGTANDEFAQVVQSNTVSQKELVGLSLQETIFSPSADHFEIGAAGPILDKLNNIGGGAGASDLAYTTPPQTSGLGVDTAWAFQWNLTVPSADELTIVKDKYLRDVPEPASLALMAAGGMMICARRRRR